MGIRRDELPYAVTMLQRYVRDSLEEMIGWFIGVRHGFDRSAGKYFKRYLPEDIYLSYTQTFPDGSYEHFWQSIKNSCGLFHKVAELTAESLGLSYPEEYEQGFMKYMELVKKDEKAQASSDD